MTKNTYRYWLTVSEAVVTTGKTRQAVHELCDKKRVRSKYVVPKGKRQRIRLVNEADLRKWMAKSA